MQRRRLLRLAGASTLPAAGCVGNLESNDDSLDLGETYDPEGGRAVTVDGVRIRELIRSTAFGSPTHVDVGCLDGHQFAVVDGEQRDSAGTSKLEDVEVAIEIDDVRYPQPDQTTYREVSGLDERPGEPAVPVPVIGASTAAVVWVREDGPSARWTLPTETAQKFRAAPMFSVDSVEVPDSVTRGNLVEATFTVANTGGRDGRFVAEFGAGGISDHQEIVVTVPEGETRTYSDYLDPYVHESINEIDVTLNWGCERLRQSVSIVD